MPQVKLRQKSQITIPKKIVGQLHLTEGDLFDIEIKRGKIILEPQAAVSKDETCLHNPQAQSSLERGLKDIKEGRTYGPFDNADDLIESLNS